MPQTLLVYLESEPSSSNHKLLQESANTPVEIRCIEPKPSLKPHKKLPWLIQRHEGNQAFVYIEKGTELTPSWTQAFTKALHLQSFKPFFIVPKPGLEIFGDETSKLTAKERAYLSGIWNHECAGFVTAPHKNNLSTIGVPSQALSWFRKSRSDSQLENWFSQLDSYQLLDVWSFPTETDRKPQYELNPGKSSWSPKRLVSTQRLHNTEPTLGLSMIVKNEEKVLERCLSSIAPIIDEFVIFDTGSTDNTKEIIKKFGGKVYETTLDDDFSKARNEAIDAMDTDWVWSMDADEDLCFSDLSKLQELTQDPSAEAYQFQTRSYHWWNQNFMDWSDNDRAYPHTSRYPGWVTSLKVRLFRNDPRVRFKGELHELLEYDLHDALIPVYNSEIPIHHFGELEPGGKEKLKRYAKMAKKKLESTKDLSKGHLEYGIILAQMKQHEDAIEHHLRGIRENRLLPFNYTAIFQNLYILKEYDALLELSSFMLEQGIHLQNVIGDIQGVEKEKAKAGGSQQKYLGRVVELLKDNSWDSLYQITEQRKMWTKNWKLRREYSEDLQEGLLLYQPL